MMRKAILLVATAMALHCLPAAAAPRAETMEECHILADFGLVIGALAKHGVPLERARSMLVPDVYAVKKEERAQLLFDLTARAAYAFIEGGHGKPMEFANLLGLTCVSQGGNLDSVLGTAL
jgi:hypothetical protein